MARKLYCVCGLVFWDKYSRSGHQAECHEFIRYRLGLDMPGWAGKHRTYDKRVQVITDNESHARMEKVAKVLGWRLNQVTKWCIDKALGTLEKRAGKVKHQLEKPIPRELEGDKNA